MPVTEKASELLDFIKKNSFLKNSIHKRFYSNINLHRCKGIIFHNLEAIFYNFFVVVYPNRTYFIL